MRSVNRCTHRSSRLGYLGVVMQEVGSGNPGRYRVITNATSAWVSPPRTSRTGNHEAGAASWRPRRTRRSNASSIARPLNEQRLAPDWSARYAKRRTVRKQEAARASREPLLGRRSAA